MGCIGNKAVEESNNPTTGNKVTKVIVSNNPKQILTTTGNNNQGNTPVVNVKQNVTTSNEKKPEKVAPKTDKSETIPKNIEIKEKPFSKVINYGQELDQKKIDSFLNSAPKREKTKLEDLEKYFADNLKDWKQIEKAYLLFCWLSYNITYDSKGLEDGTVDRTYSGSYQKGTTVCAGYADLFKHMGNSLGIEIDYITGWSKGSGYDPEHFNKEDLHAWNTLKLDETTFLVDPTWGAGSSDDDGKYNMKLTPFYYLTPPDLFLLDHFPKDNAKQLMLEQEIINFDQFLERCNFSSSFFSLGFTNTNCKNKIYKDVGTNKVFIFEYENKKKLYMMVKVTKIDINAWVSKITKNKGKGKDEKKDSNKEEQKEKKDENKNSTKEPNAGVGEMGEVEGEEIEYCSFIQRKDNKFLVDVLFNKNGKYVVAFFAKEEGMEKYSGIAEYIIYCPCDAKKEKFYPKHYGTEHFNIIEPAIENMNIELGEYYNFKIEAPEFSSFYLLQEKTSTGKNSYFTLKKEGNCFMEEKVYAYADNLKLCYFNEKDKTYSTVYEFKTNNLKNLRNITFPQAYTGKYTKLISPMKGELLIGTKESFKVKASDVEKMYINIKDSFIEMDKQGDIFEFKDLLIFDKSIDLCYFNTQIKKYSTLFSFTGIPNPNIKEKVTFPKIYSQKKSRVIEPLSGELLKGTNVNFKATIYDVEKMFILQGNSKYEMDKNGDCYEYPDMPIYADEIILACYNKNEKTFSHLIEYTGINNPKIKGKIQQPPITYSIKKTRVIEPKNYELLKGTTIKFKLKAYGVNKLYIGQKKTIDAKSIDTAEMDKLDDNTFELDAYIYGDIIAICYKENEQDSTYDYILEYKGINNPEIKDKITYPEVYKGVKNKLIFPLKGELEQGTKTKFQVQAHNTKRMRVYQDNNVFEMDKKSESVFNLSDMYIFGNDIDLAYMDSKENWHTLYGYQGVKDPKNKNEVSYPKCFTGIKSKLIAPICKNLKKGTTVKFQVQTNETEEIIVIVSEWNKLTKGENNIFEGEVKIDCNKCKICYKDKNGDCFGLYEYTVVE